MPNFRNKQKTGKVETDILVVAGASYVSGSDNKPVTVAPVYSKIDTVTLAQLNAGKEILPAIPGKRYKIVGYLLKFNGAFATATSIVLRDSNGTPVVVSTVAIAAATDGAKVTSEAVIANVTDGAGLFGLLTAGAALNIAKVGSNASGGTSILVKVLYSIE